MYIKLKFYFKARQKKYNDLNLTKIHPSKNDLNQENNNSDSIKQKNIEKESFDDLDEIRQEEE